VAVKFATVAPAATITDAGTISAALLDESPTEDPPVDAAEDTVTEQLVVAPEAMELGEQDRPEIDGEGGGGVEPADTISIALTVGLSTTGVIDIAIVPLLAVTL